LFYAGISPTRIPSAARSQADVDPVTSKSAQIKARDAYPHPAAQVKLTGVPLMRHPSATPQLSPPEASQIVVWHILLLPGL
jgi:hypothetical protein